MARPRGQNSVSKGPAFPTPSVVLHGISISLRHLCALASWKLKSRSTCRSIWRPITGIFYHTCNDAAHTRITSDSWCFGLKDERGGHQKPATALPVFCSEETWFQDEMAWMKWICRESGESGLYKMLRDQGGHPLDWGECCRPDAVNMWQLNPDSALAACKWTGHILKQMTLRFA